MTEYYLFSFNLNFLQLYHNHDLNKSLGNSPCYFALAAVYGQLEKRGHKGIHKSFDETNESLNFTQLLLHIAERSRSELEFLACRFNLLCLRLLQFAAL